MTTVAELPPTWTTGFVMLYECGINLCFPKPLYLVASLFIQLSFQPDQHTQWTVFEWVSESSGACCFILYQHNTRAREEEVLTRNYSLALARYWKRPPCTVLWGGPHLLPSVSSLVTSDVSPHCWQILLCRPKETKLECHKSHSM